MFKRIKNLLVTVLVLGVCITAVGFVPRDTGYDYTVGIVQLVRHSALDAATQGFTDALSARMEEAGKTIRIDYQDAQNDTVNCSVIANNFVAKGYDLIMANATAALQACYNATEDIPVLGTSVTVYDVALGLQNYDAAKGTGTNVSGTSDLAPLQEQAQMLAELVPSARKIGLLYCSSEANSKYQVDEVARYLQVEQAKRNAAEVAARRADAERAQARQAQSAAASPDDTDVVDAGASACEQSPSNLDLDVLLRDKGTHYGVWGDAVVHAEDSNQ